MTVDVISGNLSGVGFLYALGIIITARRLRPFVKNGGFIYRLIRWLRVLNKSIFQCPSGSIALYCRHFKFSNFRHPFTIFVLNVLEYYRISFGQIQPHGLSKVSKSIVPFKLVWRHPDAILIELEPSESELDDWLLKALKECPSRLRPFPQHLLFLMGVSVLWDKPDRDPVLSTFVILCVFIFFLCLCLFVFIM
ncbi:hypothetical protein Hanom_Chr09g00770601 [Helianthus anomalus]